MNSFREYLNSGLSTTVSEKSITESKYKTGDSVTYNGKGYVLDVTPDGIFASDNDGNEIEFRPGMEDRHDSMSESNESELDEIKRLINFRR